MVGYTTPRCGFPPRTLIIDRTDPCRPHASPLVGRTDKLTVAKAVATALARGRDGATVHRPFTDVGGPPTGPDGPSGGGPLLNWAGRLLPSSRAACSGRPSLSLVLVSASVWSRLGSVSVSVSARLGLGLGQIRPRLGLGLGQIRPRLGQIRPDLGQIRPDLGHIWPRSGLIWPRSGHI